MMLTGISVDGSIFIVIIFDDPEYTVGHRHLVCTRKVTA